jgi:hypothetical protein
MGYHNVPRRHLRRFVAKPGGETLWMYDKVTRLFKEAAIKTVAQEKGYYDSDVERALANTVETPGNSAIDKILKCEPINHAERSELSLYLMIMLTRGPRHRKKVYSRVPETMGDVLSEIEFEIREWIKEEPNNQKAHERLDEFHDLRAKYSSEIPQNVIELRRPFWSERTVESILNMFWHIVPAPPGHDFITSDSPAHVFDSYGLATWDSEYTISLSKEFALIGKHKSNPGLKYEKPNAQIAKEVNRRILSVADRFVFSPQNDSWIESVALKPTPFLSTIQW